MLRTCWQEARSLQNILLAVVKTVVRFGAYLDMRSYNLREPVQGTISLSTPHVKKRIGHSLILQVASFVGTLHIPNPELAT